MSKAFRKVYLHHEVVYKMNNVAEFTSAWFFYDLFWQQFKDLRCRKGF